MTLPEYLKEFTPEQVQRFCKRAGLDPRSVHRWKNGEGGPNVKNAVLIEQHTDGVVSFREAMGAPPKRGTA